MRAQPRPGGGTARACTPRSPWPRRAPPGSHRRRSVYPLSTCQWRRELNSLDHARVLGVRVDCVDMAAALARIEAMVDEGGHHLVATLNPEFVMLARRDREFARVLDSAALSLPDGSGVVWAARRKGCAMSAPVTGTDLI